MFELSVSPPRCYLGGLRIHHGLTGLVLAGIGFRTKKRSLFLLGALLTAEDFKDIPWSFFDH